MVNMPNFLIIGATRAGTTALYNFLNQHPQIYMSENKEPGFFIFDGIDPQNPYSDREYTVSDLDTYQNLFREANENHVAVGEATTGYLSSQFVPERIQEYIPDVKLIALLRDPVDRAYSEYELLLRSGRETLTFEQAIQQEPREPMTDLAWNPDELKYLRKGMYFAHLSRYYSVFDPSQIAVFLYSDWRDNRLETLRSIYEFLGVDSQFKPDTDIEHNVGGVPKNEFIYNLIFGSNPLKKIAKEVIPTKRIKQVKSMFLDRSKSGLTPEIRQDLISIYRSDIEELQQLIQRDLSEWVHN